MSKTTYENILHFLKEYLKRVGFLLDGHFLPRFMGKVIEFSSYSSYEINNRITVSKMQRNTTASLQTITGISEW